jgi:two-component system cell cycle sensor histidine kinase/response regulator CckA
MSEVLRLFLVEDDDDIALLMRKALQRAGHHVTRCRTAADALIVLGHSSFDLVLLDQRLPDMSGLDLLQALGSEGITTPVLMVTGYGDEQLATQVLRAGALDYVVKDPALTFLADLPKRVGESVTRHGLQDMNRLLIESLESTRDGIAISDLQGTFLHVNRALERMSGYSREELLGQTPRLFKSGLHPPEFYASMWRTILARNSWQGEVINRRKDSTLLDASLTISPILDGRGQMTHFVAIYRDISDRKQLERQLLQAQKMQSVGTLAGGVAHEFNNLLAGIQGYADLGLRDPGLTPTLRDFLERIVNLTGRAANLTRQLLAYARKPALSRQPVCVDKLVRSTAELVGHTLHAEVKLELADSGPEGEALSALADANQLQQVLINLALNARDAMTAGSKPENSQPPGPIVFGLRHILLQGDLPAFPENVPPGDYVVIEVRDSGSGMTPDVLAQAFDPFFTTKEVGQGTGLGLPVAFGIVRGHQGFLTIDTMPGQGTCVSLYLPRLLAPGQGAALFEPGQVLEPDSLPGRHILLVDDEEAVLDVVRRFLEIAGHQVTCATSGEQAVQLMEDGLPAELVILDLVMPREDGCATFQRLRQLRPGLPVLLCTGIVQSDPTPLLADGAAGLLRKPFRMNELWYAVNQALPV